MSAIVNTKARKHVIHADGSVTLETANGTKVRFAWREKTGITKIAPLRRVCDNTEFNQLRAEAAKIIKDAQRAARPVPETYHNRYGLAGTG